MFHRSVEDAWAEWVRFEKTFQQKNLETIRKYPLTPYHDITSRALGSVSRAYYDEKAGKIYAGLNYPGVVSHVGAIDVQRGAVERLVDIKGPIIYTVTSLAWDPDSRRLFYTTDNAALRDLVLLDPATGHTRLLQKDARIGDLAYSRADKILWGIRHLNGLATLVRIDPPYTSWKQVHTFEYGEIPYDLDVSPDGRTLSVLVRRGERPPERAPGGRGRVDEGRHHAGGPVRLRVGLGAEQLRLLSRRPVSLRELVLFRRVQHLPLRHPVPESRCGDQH